MTQPLRLLQPPQQRLLQIRRAILPMFPLIHGVLQGTHCWSASSAAHCSVRVRPVVLMCVCRALALLRKRGTSWRDMYWWLWSLCTVLQCAGCGAQFTAARLAECPRPAPTPTADASPAAAAVLFNCPECKQAFLGSITTADTIAVRCALGHVTSAVIFRISCGMSVGCG